MRVPETLRGKPKSKLSVTDCVYLCLRKGRYMMFHEIKEMINQNTGKYYGEATISAAIRDLRNEGPRAKYGLHPYEEVVIKRRRKNSKGYEYKLLEYQDSTKIY